MPDSGAQVPDIRRFEAVHARTMKGECGAVFEENNDGDFVTYVDHIKRIVDHIKRIALLTQENAALRQENERLKDEAERD